jgi:hypothetical protein
MRARGRENGSVALPRPRVYRRHALGEPPGVGVVRAVKRIEQPGEAQVLVHREEDPPQILRSFEVLRQSCALRRSGKSAD